MYSQEDAARWLDDHPDYYPVFQEGRARLSGVVSLVGFRSGDLLLSEIDFPQLFHK